MIETPHAQATLIVSTVGIIQDGGEEAATNSGGDGASESRDVEAVMKMEMIASGWAVAALAHGASQRDGETHVTLSIESGPATRPPVDGAAGSAGVLLASQFCSRNSSFRDGIFAFQGKGAVKAE